MDKTFKPRIIEAVQETPSVKAEAKPQRKQDTARFVTSEKVLDSKPLSLFVEPYLVELWGVKDLYVDNINGLQDKIKTIDEYIVGKIRASKMGETVGSYREVLKLIEEKLGISSNHPRFAKVDLIFEIVSKALKDKKLEKRLGIKIIHTFNAF